MNGYDVVVVGGGVAGASSSRTRASGSRWSSGPVRAATRCRRTG